MHDYLTQQPALLPQPATLLSIADDKFHLQQGFTRDRDALLRALAAAPTKYAWKLEVNGKTDHGPIERLDQSLSALEQIAREIRNMYTLGYAPPAGKGPGLRRVQVRVSAPGTGSSTAASASTTSNGPAANSVSATGYSDSSSGLSSAVTSAINVTKSGTPSSLLGTGASTGPDPLLISLVLDSSDLWAGLGFKKRPRSL